MNKSRRLSAVTVAVLVLVLVLSGTAFAADPNTLAPKSFDPQPEPPGVLRIFLNEVELETDTEPLIINGRTFVPMRAIFEALGAELTWNGLEQSVVARSGEVSVQLWIGRTKALVNGAEVALDAAPFINEGRTMVPLRFIGEAFGYEVNWDGAQRLINIVSNGPGAEPDDNNQPEPPGFTPDPPPPGLPGQLRAPLQKTYELTLRAAPTTLQENEMVTFDGYLTYTTVFSNTPAAAAGREITIYQVSETSTGTYNSVLGTAVTDSQGYYYYKLVPFETAGYYAVYEGDDGQDLAKSSQATVTVEKKTVIPIRKDIIKILGN